MEQHCLTQLLFFSSYAAVLFSLYCGCKGNDIWEILPLLMYNTTNTSPCQCSFSTESLFHLVISALH